MYQGKFSAEKAEKPLKEIAKEKPVKQKGAKRGTVLFYSIYGICSGIVLIAILLLLIPLHSWLKNYQASQPETKAQQIFDELFAQPDWEALYVKAGIPDSPFEDKTAYAAYMKDKVGQDKLTCMQTSAGLSGDRKYVIRHGSEKIASYTLTSTEGPNSKTKVWELGKLELMLQQKHNVIVEKSPGETVYINGVALDESYIVKKISTKAQDYLPDGANGYQREQVKVTSLLMPPQIVVKNTDGTVVETTADEFGMLSTPVSDMTISQTEKDAAIGAAKAHALFSIEAAGRSELRKYFDVNSQVYDDICNTVIFMQDYNGYRFDDSATAVSEYYRYSDMLYSARVTLALKVTRTNGTVKTYDANTTYFFTKGADGTYKATGMTNVPIQERLEQVRITFINGNDTLSSEFVSTDAQTITLPQVTPAEGEVLIGWATQQTDAAGRVITTVQLTPGEDGNAHLSGQVIDAMTLYPVFEKQGA